jgi:peptidoglycan hydrolase-like protein with peptidoglycan-binding domain
MFHKYLLRASFAVILLGVLVSSGLLFAKSAFADEITIEQGSTGPAVMAWQIQLNEITNPKCSGYLDLGSAMTNPLQEDSDFGPLTLAATIAFQEKTGLDPDGVVGPLTHSKMDSLLSQSQCNGY